MYRSLKLMFREPDNTRHNVSICDGVLMPVKMCFLNTIWGCTKQLSLHYAISELMPTRNSIRPIYCPEKQLNSITSAIFTRSSINISKSKLLQLSKYER